MPVPTSWDVYAVTPDVAEIPVTNEFEPFEADAGEEMPFELADDELAEELIVAPAFGFAAMATIPSGTGTFRGFRTRAQIGLKSPRNVSRNVHPQHGGVAGHWNGPRIGIGANTPHRACERAWRNMQAYHMGSNVWTDIAYNIGVCQHGYALAGRGYGVRSAAQGTNDGNDRYLAVQWIGGQGDTPTADAYAAFDWAVNAFLSAGAGREVKPHSAIHQTNCPGPDMTRKVRALDGRNVTTAPAPTLRPGELVVDGALGPNTWSRLVAAMGSPVGTGALWTRLNTALGLGEANRTPFPNRQTARVLQALAGFAVTGIWDDATNRDGVAALQVWLNKGGKAA